MSTRLSALLSARQLLLSFLIACHCLTTNQSRGDDNRLYKRRPTRNQIREVADRIVNLGFLPITAAEQTEMIDLIASYPLGALREVPPPQSFPNRSLLSGIWSRTTDIIVGLGYSYDEWDSAEGFFSSTHDDGRIMSGRLRNFRSDIGFFVAIKEQETSRLSWAKKRIEKPRGIANIVLGPFASITERDHRQITEVLQQIPEAQVIWKKLKAGESDRTIILLRNLKDPTLASTLMVSLQEKIFDLNERETPDNASETSVRGLEYLVRCDQVHALL
ncbi:MAG: hypothetical protein C5B49_12315 [Bdellovibrio sp.]|nr:MAG: hypothetical protein C5B49_12315 [Bdellovibrio sp.]